MEAFTGKHLGHVMCTTKGALGVASWKHWIEFKNVNMLV